jgi:outer membrane protein OmpA-like peptidoglycan-associated protein
MRWQNILLISVIGFTISGCTWFKKTFVRSTEPVVEKKAEVKPKPVKKRRMRKIFKPDPNRDAVVLHYGFKEIELSKTKKMSLHDIIQSLKADPKLSVTIEGHTDDVGSREFNILVGERRAKAVKKHLLKQGISEKQMLLVSFGEERPVTNSMTKQGRRKNRRVVVELKQPRKKL